MQSISVPDQFTSILPCFISFSSADTPLSCTLCLDISKTNVSMKIYQTGSKQEVRFNHTEFCNLTIFGSHCTFSDEKYTKDVSFYFFNNEANFRRFIYTLSDAGLLLMPSLSHSASNAITKVKFLPQHSFIPTGNYNFKKFPINRHIALIIRSQVTSITKTYRPFYPQFIDLVTQPLHKNEMTRFVKWKESNRSKLVTLKPLNMNLFFNKLHKKVTIQKDYFEYKEKLLNATTIPQNYKKNFSDVDKDSNRMKDSFSKKWNDKLRNICSVIIKVNLLKNGVYFFQGNFDIIKKLALILKGDCKKENDTEVPSYIKNMDSDEFEQFLFSCYSYFAQMFYVEGLEEKNILHGVLSSISSSAFNAFEKLTPCVAAYLTVRKIESFSWATDDLAPLFSKTFDNVFLVWYFFLSTSKPFVASALLHAALLFIAVPQLVNQNVQNETGVVAFWPNFKRGLKDNAEELKKAIEIATYFYLEAGKIDPHS
ncbi:hypothetical protein TRFO_06507 [Tritrichomonas foetus]|uniref:Uncharacterized protein n=1 Tax=Tritrichomonas foetus TaxID=1144522 RepID=A0A1J4JYZ3_9EUKA|nr:hypothetical protein TRFO_06507 [Tritrichomonas foetus]|eukprot:OHT03704.1 hypothetical protein TRFO_06507 [Tritrichomonas foetus]